MRKQRIIAAAIAALLGLQAVQAARAQSYGGPQYGGMPGMRAMAKMSGMAGVPGMAGIPGMPGAPEMAGFPPMTPQMGMTPMTMPPATTAGLPSLGGNAQLDLQEDRQLAAEARSEYEEYGRRVQQYIADLQERVAEAHIRRGEVLARRSQLKKQLPALKGAAREEAQQELASLNSWLDAEKSMSSIAARNVQYCQQWLRSERAEVNNAEYNAAEDQQAIADAQRKAAEQAAEQRWQQQLAAESALRAQMNNGLGWGGGYGYWGGGYGYYGPRYHGYHGHYGSHLMYGGGGGGGVHWSRNVVHVGGGGGGNR